MNKGLVWNFELTLKNQVDLTDLKDSRDELRWEARFFWPSDSLISLSGLDTRFLELSNYELKQRQDCYTLLADSNFNIKQRRMQLFYKPLLQEAGSLRGYGKKISLTDYATDFILPGSNNLFASELVKKIESSGQEIEVTKEALVYKFPSEPTLKLELSRLRIARQIYHSLCVEGHSQRLVAYLARELQLTQVSCDYVSFLKQISHAN